MNAPQTPASPRAQQIRTLVAGYLLLALCAVAFTLTPLHERLQDAVGDLQFSAQRQLGWAREDDNLRIIGLDEADLEAFGAPVAMLHQPLGELLTALTYVKPRAVALDLLLPTRSYDRLAPGLDAALARGLVGARRAYPLVVGIGLQPDGSPRPLHPLFARLTGEAGQGFVMVMNDADGVVRHFDESFGGSGEPLRSLAGQVARALSLPLRAGRIDYSIGPAYVYVPVREALAWAAAGDAERLRREFGGKIVLLGSVLPFDDLHRTPLPLASWTDDPARAPGVLLHAQILRSLLADSLLREPPRWLAPVLAAAAAAAWVLTPGWLASVALAAACAGLAWAGLLFWSRGLALPLAGAMVVALCAQAVRASYTAFLGARERRRLRAAFGGAVSPAVLKEILSGKLDPTLGGMRREICVLFSDIRGFTTLSEHLSPEEVTALLNDYFERMTRAVHSHGGTVDKFIGDGMMAFFGAPQSEGNPCADAFAVAKRMVLAVEKFNADQARLGRPPIAIGVGLNYGPAVVGYIGAMERHEYSAIGDTVNTASRIEGLTKDSGFPLLVSAAVYARLSEPDQATLTRLGAKAVKGRADVEVMGWKMQIDQGANDG